MRWSFAPATRPVRVHATALAVTATMAAALIVAADPTAAEAAVFTCSVSDHVGYCAHVTAINTGSYLAQHNAPNYTSGHNNYRGHNGDVLQLGCWTTGSPDADGHGDRYWFDADDGFYGGYVNDWYVTSGSYGQWSRYIPHC